MSSSLMRGPRAQVDREASAIHRDLGGDDHARWGPAAGRAARIGAVFRQHLQPSLLGRPGEHDLALGHLEPPPEQLDEAPAGERPDRAVHQERLTRSACGPGACPRPRPPRWDWCGGGPSRSRPGHVQVQRQGMLVEPPRCPRGLSESALQGAQVLRGELDLLPTMLPVGDLEIEVGVAQRQLAGDHRRGPVPPRARFPETVERRFSASATRKSVNRPSRSSATVPESVIRARPPTSTRALAGREPGAIHPDVAALQARRAPRRARTSRRAGSASRRRSERPMVPLRLGADRLPRA